MEDGLSCGYLPAWEYFLSPLDASGFILYSLGWSTNNHLNSTCVLNLDFFLVQSQMSCAGVACEYSRLSSLPAGLAFRERDVCDSRPKIPY